MKLSEMREKTADELQNAIIDWKRQLLEARLQLSAHKLDNTASISKTKRLIAQAKTVITEKANEKEPAVKAEEAKAPAHRPRAKKSEVENA